MPTKPIILQFSWPQNPGPTNLKILPSATTASSFFIQVISCCFHQDCSALHNTHRRKIVEQANVASRISQAYPDTTDASNIWGSGFGLHVTDAIQHVIGVKPRIESITNYIFWRSIFIDTFHLLKNILCYYDKIFYSNIILL